MTDARSDASGTLAEPRTDLLVGALDVNQAWLALGNEVFDTEDARVVRNRSTPNVWDSNHVSHVRASTPKAIDYLLARAEREFDGADSISFHVDPRTPAEFAARLAHEDYERTDMLVMVLEGDLVGSPVAGDIRPVDSDVAWEQYAGLHEIDWHEYRDKLPGAGNDVWLHEEMMTARRRKSPPVRYWLAFVDGHPRAYFASWEGTGGVGQVEDLFTHPDYRHRGLASALIHHCVADVRSPSSPGRTRPVVIVAGAGDTPKRMYAAMGFLPLAIKQTYRKKRR